SYSGIPRLYVHAAGSREPVEVSHYIKGLSSSSYMVGPAPVQLVVRFPRPTFSIVSRLSESEKRDRWTRLLMDLPKQHAVVVLSPEHPAVIKVVPVAEPAASQGLSRFMSTALVANGQTLAEIDEVYNTRRARIQEGDEAYRKIRESGEKRTAERTNKRPSRFEKEEAEAEQKTKVYQPQTKALKPLPLPAATSGGEGNGDMGGFDDGSID
uniref:hypothetical protein n=1 Tax=Armatimonas sp. TaxID=1872638 RepID=UPI003751A434